MLTKTGLNFGAGFHSIPNLNSLEATVSGFIYLTFCPTSLSEPFLNLFSFMLVH